MDAAETARRCAERMYADDAASQSLGITISDVAPGTAIASMKVRDDMVNGHRICHGGYIFTLADTAFAFACNTHGPAVVAAGADVSFLAPVRAGDALVAEGVERVVRGRSGLYDVTVRCGETVVAELRGRSRAIG